MFPIGTKLNHMAQGFNFITVNEDYIQCPHTVYNFGEYHEYIFRQKIIMEALLSM